MLLVDVSFFGKGNFVWDIMILRKWIESFGGKKNVYNNNNNSNKEKVI